MIWTRLLFNADQLDGEIVFPEMVFKDVPWRQFLKVGMCLGLEEFSESFQGHLRSWWESLPVAETSCRVLWTEQNFFLRWILHTFSVLFLNFLIWMWRMLSILLAKHAQRRFLGDIPMRSRNVHLRDIKDFSWSDYSCKSWYSLIQWSMIIFYPGLMPVLFSLVQSFDRLGHWGDMRQRFPAFFCRRPFWAST